MKSLVSSGRAFCVLLFIATCFTGCSRKYGVNAAKPLPTNSDMTCKEYLLSIPLFWQVKEGYYEFVADSPTFYSRFVQNTNICFQGFTVKDVKKHLGEPNTETPSELLYYVTEPCLTRNRDCNVQVFKIENGFFKQTMIISPEQYKG